MRHNSTRCLLFIFASLALVACGGGSPSAELPVGACVHQYVDPVLHVDSVVNATTGQAISTVNISNVSYNSVPVEQALLLQGSENVTRSDSTLICTVPCGLFNAEGTYTFTASASGYAAQSFSVSAQYARFTGGCPSSSSGGTAINLQLQQQ